MIRALLLIALLASMAGCTALDLWDAPDVVVEERVCAVDIDCENVRFEVDESLRNDPCLVAERSCDENRGLCTVTLRARDSDRDNFRDIACAETRLEFAPFDVDCDDTDTNAYPYADRDGDGFIVAGCGYGMAEDCDDGRATAFPGATVEACDGVVSTCTDTTPPLRRPVEDFDRDGFAPIDLDPSVCADVTNDLGELLTIPHTDCDDTDELVYAGAPDACDGRHNDCSNEEVGVGRDPGEDVDGDGFASPSSLSCDPDLGLPNSDCDDLNPNTYPNAPESCDLEINDCVLRTGGMVSRPVEDPDGDGRFAGNADCIDASVNIECSGAGFDRFSAFCLPSGETQIVSAVSTVSAMRTADFNADGIDEFVYVRNSAGTPCATSDQITLRYSTNIGNPLVSTATICDPAGTSTQNVALVDVDGDTPLEIVTLSAAGTLISYDVNGSVTLTMAAKASMGVTVTAGAFAIGRLDGVATPVIVALEGTTLGYRPLDGTGAAGAVTPIDAASGGITGVVIGDATNDGVRDVVTFSSASSVIAIYPGISGGTFAAKTTLDAAALLPGIGNVSKLSLADVEGDADGDLDLVVAGSSGLGVLARRGSTFEGIAVGIRTNGQPLPVGGIVATDVTVTDLDADGRREIVYADAALDSVGYIDEMGTGVFAQHVFVADFDGATLVAAGDFDGDFDMDIAAYAPALTLISRFNSFFVSNVAYGGRLLDRAFDTGAIDAGDMDVDGITDVVGASSDPGGDLLVWRAHVRDFSLIDEVVALRAGPGETFSGIAVGDVTGDLRPDIAVVSEGSDSVGFVRGNGDLTFAAREFVAPFDAPSSVAAANLDGDPALEIIVASNGGAEGRLAVYAKPSGQSGFTRTIIAATTAPCAEVAVGDVDDDGDLDLAVACRTSGLSVFVNPGAIAGTWTEFVLDTGAGGSNTTSVDLFDVDRDGDDDVVSYRADSASVVIHEASGGVVLSSPTLVPCNVASTTGAKVRGADVDRDGDMDIFVAGLDTGGAVKMLQSVGNTRLRYVPLTIRQGGASGRPTALAAADVDRDGDDDMLLSIRDDRDVYYLRSSGTPWWNR